MAGEEGRGGEGRGGQIEAISIYRGTHMWGLGRFRWQLT